MRVERGRGVKLAYGGTVGRRTHLNVGAGPQGACPVGSGICGSGAGGQLVLYVCRVYPACTCSWGRAAGVGPPRKCGAVRGQDLWF